MKYILVSFALLLPMLPPAAAQTPPPGPFRDCPACPEMSPVPAGKFTMGSAQDEEGRDRDEGPVREVVIARGFAIGKLETTFREWDACAADGGCKQQPSDEHWGRDERPVINVSWSDAKEYAAWLSKKTGKAYRLPSEAEWEYAARGGTTGPFYWGPSEDDACEYAVVRSSWLGCGTGRDALAGTKHPNTFGLYDMSGNVWEWTEDCYFETYDKAPKDGSAREGDDCKRRVTRGGAWDLKASEARSANRNPRTATDRNYTIGFRVARDL